MLDCISFHPCDSAEGGNTYATVFFIFLTCVKISSAPETVGILCKLQLLVVNGDCTVKRLGEHMENLWRTFLGLDFQYSTFCNAKCDNAVKS